MTEELLFDTARPETCRAQKTRTKTKHWHPGQLRLRLRRRSRRDILHSRPRRDIRRRGRNIRIPLRNNSLHSNSALLRRTRQLLPPSRGGFRLRQESLWTKNRFPRCLGAAPRLRRHHRHIRPISYRLPRLLHSTTQSTTIDRRDDSGRDTLSDEPQHFWNR